VKAAAPAKAAKAAVTAKASKPAVKATKAAAPAAKTAKAAKPAKAAPAAKPVKASKVVKPAKPTKLVKAPKPAKAAVPPVATPTGAKPVRRKEKLVRDSFTMPRADFELIAALKTRALGFQHAAKKSELLRAGLQALTALPDNALKTLLAQLPQLKTGRPKKAD
jgi:hypothetical protein